jgi:hypothetical protein
VFVFFFFFRTLMNAARQHGRIMSSLKNKVNTEYCLSSQPQKNSYMPHGITLTAYIH